MHHINWLVARNHLKTQLPLLRKLKGENSNAAMIAAEMTNIMGNGDDPRKIQKACERLVSIVTAAREIGRGTHPELKKITDITVDDAIEFVLYVAGPYLRVCAGITKGIPLEDVNDIVVDGIIGWRKHMEDPSVETRWPFSWVGHIVNLKRMDYLRRYYRRRKAQERLEQNQKHDGILAINHQSFNSDEWIVNWEAIHELSEDDIDILLVLEMIEGWSQRELAEKHGMTRDEVRHAIDRGLGKIRRLLSA